MPATAAFIAKDRRFLNVNRHLLNNPDINLKLGQDYILHLLETPVVDQHLFKLLVAYNAGPGNLNKWLKKIDHREDSFLMLESIPARETRGYVKSVTMNIWMYRLKEGGSGSGFRTLVAGEGTNGNIAFLRTNVGKD
jgi:soluble lytic murein transglycosylase-like protein